MNQKIPIKNKHLLNEILELNQKGMVGKLRKRMLERQDKQLLFNGELQELDNLGLVSKSQTIIKHAFNRDGALTLEGLILLFCHVSYKSKEEAPEYDNDFSEETLQKIMLLLDRSILIEKYEAYRDSINNFLNRLSRHPYRFKELNLNEDWLIVGEGLRSNDEIQKELFDSQSNVPNESEKTTSKGITITFRKVVFISLGLIIIMGFSAYYLTKEDDQQVLPDDKIFVINSSGDANEMHRRFAFLANGRDVESIIGLRVLADSCIETSKYRDVGLYFKAIYLMKTQRFESNVGQEKPVWYFYEINTESPYFDFGMGQLFNYYRSKYEPIDQIEYLHLTLDFLKMKGRKHTLIYYFISIQRDKLKSEFDPKYQEIHFFADLMKKREDFQSDFSYTLDKYNTKSSQLIDPDECSIIFMHYYILQELKSTSQGMEDNFFDPGLLMWEKQLLNFKKIHNTSIVETGLMQMRLNIEGFEIEKW